MFKHAGTGFKRQAPGIINSMATHEGPTQGEFRKNFQGN